MSKRAPEMEGSIGPVAELPAYRHVWFVSEVDWKNRIWSCEYVPF